MRIDLSEEGSLLRKAFFVLRWPIVFFSLAIFLLALFMSKIHPERVSYAKEYNYLYSIIDDLENGKEGNFDIIKGKLDTFTSLHPEVDAHFIKKYVRDSDYFSAEVILEGVNRRIAIKNSSLETFSSASLKIEKSDNEKGYREALSIKENTSLKETFPFLYAYNLFRIFILEEMLNYHDKALLTVNDLSEYIEGMKGTDNFENPLVKQIYKKINK